MHPKVNGVYSDLRTTLLPSLWKSGPVFTKNLKVKSSFQQANLGATPKNNGRVSRNFENKSYSQNILSLKVAPKPGRT